METPREGETPIDKRIRELYAEIMHLESDVRCGGTEPSPWRHELEAVAKRVLGDIQLLRDGPGPEITTERLDQLTMELITEALRNERSLVPVV